MYLKIQVLITASSNTAVDNLTAAVVKLLKQSTYIARDCGQIIRFRTEKAQIAAFRAQSATRNYLLRRDSSFFNPDTLQHEAHVLVRNYMRSHPSQESCRDLSALDALDTDRGLDSREYGLFQKAYQEVLTLVLQESRVVASTLSNSGNLVLRSVQGFQPALILSDEAGQSLEGEAMIGLTTPSLRAVVLIGDPFQLPPTVLSEHAKNEWAHFLKRSLLERLRDARYPATQLRLNYRNHPDILRFFNDRVYHGTLIPHQANTNPRKVGPSGVVFDEWMHQISRRFGGHYDDLVGQRRIWVDVEGLATKESMGTSWENLAQVQAVRRILAGLFKVANGRIGLEDMMIITPYRAQLKRCRDELKLQGLAPHDIFTVDAAQGREANIVVILLTKPSAEGRGAIQFVADKARLNVALSRARQVCLVVGDLQAFTHVFHNSGGGGGNPTKFLEQLFEDVTGRNHVLPLDAVEDVEVVSQ
ncbi:hypothetical protein N7468_000135 [Penicillium chermesinum]|uniref:Uncharacterized protein n=1 Tax=Penicillium chermesinum TaxID=63820 RepID=A0A9W9PL18_9EURO|nr:uncharacterized protein N7468_000135 [Penicillium chermesinum]KAJ5248684.1 hypothetical protein N7468_000135 [Penicillium chermesinum]